MMKFSEGHVVRKRGDKRSFGDHVNQKRIFSDYEDRNGGDSLTTRFGEKEIETRPFSGPAEGEGVMKEVILPHHLSNKNIFYRLFSCTTCSSHVGK
jgi:hypothetical protein